MRAPAALRGCAGAFLFATLLLPAACAEEPQASDPRVLILGADTIVLPDSIDIVELRLSARGGTPAVEPPTAAANVGDVARFVSADHGAHTVAFDAARLTAEARAFLERTGQLRGPPLLDEGDAWVVNFAGAPAGTYPFACATHGETGVLEVGAAR